MDNISSKMVTNIIQVKKHTWDKDRILINQRVNRTTVCFCSVRKKKIYVNIITKSIVDNNHFWKTVKQNRFKETITQKTENNEIISDELKVVQTFDNYFVNIVPSSKINYDKDFFTDTYNQQDQ